MAGPREEPSWRDGCSSTARLVFVARAAGRYASHNNLYILLFHFPRSRYSHAHITYRESYPALMPNARA